MPSKMNATASALTISGPHPGPDRLSPRKLTAAAGPVFGPPALNHDAGDGSMIGHYGADFGLPVSQGYHGLGKLMVDPDSEEDGRNNDDDDGRWIEVTAPCDGDRHAATRNALQLDSGTKFLKHAHAQLEQRTRRARGRGRACIIACARARMLAHTCVCTPTPHAWTHSV